jgi:hypothetical protein
VKPPIFDGSASWTAFHHQFETAAVQNNWTLSETAAQRLSVLKGQATDVSITPLPKRHEDTVEELRGRFREQNLAAVFRLQLKVNEQTSDENAAGVRRSRGAAGSPSSC